MKHRDEYANILAMFVALASIYAVMMMIAYLLP